MKQKQQQQKTIYIFYFMCMCAQLFLAVGNPVDCSSSSSSVHGNFQARILEWVAVSASKGFSWSRKLCLLCFLHWQSVRLTMKQITIPFSSGPRFDRTLHHDPSILGGPTQHAHSFTELYKAVVHVIRLISFLWLWFSFCLPSDGEG